MEIAIGISVLCYSIPCIEASSDPAWHADHKTVEDVRLDSVPLFNISFPEVIQVERTMTEYVTVTISQGDLRGRKKTTKAGGTYCSFQGIPYAKPPVGPLKFKAPQPPEPWTGTRDALQEGSSCPHVHLITDEFVGDEDCLFVNVYTPKLPVKKSALLTPVMVWIHGGAFRQGSGDADLYGPDYLVDAGVVVVTLNYRLGVLGFLSLENSLVPGNAGLKDQVLALRWVRKNISIFGGDPNNVTIFGESAGATSVHMQLLSPMSKGLFKRAICQSGTGIGDWALAKKPRDVAFKLGEALGCNSTSDEELLTFLRQADAKQLYEIAEKLGLEEEKRGGTQLLFVANVETAVEGEEAFLIDQPLKLLSEGKFHHVPFLGGVNSHEGLLIVKGLLANPSVLDTINNAFETMVPKALKENLGPEEISELASRIKKFYFGDKAVAVDTIPEYVNLISDLYFTWDMHKTMKIHDSVSSEPIFYYEFSFDGALNLFKKHLGITQYQGACHGDDLPYLFVCNIMDVEVGPLSPERKVVTRMVKLWTNFAKTGNPTPGDDSDLPVKWIPYTTSDPAYLQINKELTVERHLEKDRMEFWEELYKLYQ